MAEADASDPWYKTVGPDAFTFDTTFENLPVTCIVVLIVSMGIKKIRNTAAEAEDATVLTPTPKSLVESRLFKSVRIPVLAAVSPKRDSGPWKRAGRTPR